MVFLTLVLTTVSLEKVRTQLQLVTLLVLHTYCLRICIYIFFNTYDARRYFIDNDKYVYSFVFIIRHDAFRYLVRKHFYLARNEEFSYLAPQLNPFKSIFTILTVNTRQSFFRLSSEHRSNAL